MPFGVYLTSFKKSNMSYLYYVHPIKPVYGQDVIEHLEKYPHIYEQCLTEEDLISFEKDDNCGNICVYAWKSVQEDENGKYVPYKDMFNGKYSRKYFYNDFSKDTIVLKKTEEEEARYRLFLEKYSK
jgi:hypothetical protein